MSCLHFHFRKVFLISILSIAGSAYASVPPCAMTGAEAPVNFYGNDFTVQYLGSCYLPNDTYFGYTVCNTHHTPGLGFSHVVYGKSVCPGNSLGAPTCLTDNCVIGSDPTTGVNGIKWNETSALDHVGECKSYYFSYPNLVGVKPVEVAVKAGNCAGGPAGCDTALLSGPSCPATPSSTPTATNTSTSTPTNTPLPPTATATATSTATNTTTQAPTNTSTNTPTNSPTWTATNIPTNTPVPPTATATETPTVTPSATATYTVSPTLDVTLIPLVTSTATPTPIAAATPPATPTETGVIKGAVTCNVAGPYISYCTAKQVSIDLKASDSGAAATYLWTSDCPGAVIANTTSVNTSITFNSFSSGNVPTGCTATLQVNDGVGSSNTCTTSIAVQGCSFDCNGTFQGTAQPDRCSKCDGDGQGCLNCQSVDVRNDQLSLDGNAAVQRSLVFQGAKFLSSGKKVSKSQKSYSKTMISQAQSLYTQTWINTYTAVPAKVLTCDSALCVQVSTTSYKKTLTTSTTSMRKLLEIALSYIPSSEHVKKIKLKKLISKSKALLVEQQKFLAQIPDVTSSCS